MSNFKKVLAMVLAVMMVMALMTTAFAAEAKALDYSDSSFQDEAMLLNELGIIVGGDSGAWDAERLVTRGEFTKMICVAMNGGVDNPALYTGENTTGLTDIDDHWAKGYIIYCFKLGIIAGVGDGTFSPNTSVTGVQAAKILLTALGYDAVKEGYVNVSDWELNINVKAGEVGLYEGLGAQYDPRQPLSRDFAAKMIANMFDARMVYYDQNISIQLEALSFGQKRLRLTTLEGALVANEYAAVGTTINGRIASITESDKSSVELKTGPSTYTVVTIPAASNVEDLGKTVKVYARYKVNFATERYFNETDYDSSYVERLYGTIAPTDSNTVYEVGRGFAAASNFSGWLADNKIRVTSPSAANSGTGTGIFAPNYDEVIYQCNSSNTAIERYFSASNEMVRGNTVKCVDNNNDRVIDYIFVIADNFAEVTNLDTSRDRITFELVGNNGSYWFDYDDIIGFDDLELAVGDRLLYTVLNDGGVMVEIVTPITGQLTGHTSAAGNNVAIVSGSNYQFANESGSLTNGKSATWTALNSSVNYNTDVSYWVDKNNFILDFKGAAASNDYLVVTASNADYKSSTLTGSNSSGYARVSVLKADGSKGTYDVVSMQLPDDPWGITDIDAGIKSFDPNATSGSSSSNADTYSIISYILGTSTTTYHGTPSITANKIVGAVFAYTADEENKTIELRRVPTTLTTSTKMLQSNYANGTSITLGGNSYIVNDSSVFFIYNSATGENKWHVFNGRTSVPSSATATSVVQNNAAIAAVTASTPNGYVVNGAKANETARVGAASLHVKVSGGISDETGRYVIAIGSPTRTGTGSSSVVKFTGIYKGEVVEMTSKAGLSSADEAKITKGAILSYEGSSDNFQSLTVNTVNNSGLRFLAGHVMEKSSDNYYTIGDSATLSDWRTVGSTSNTSFFTNIPSSGAPQLNVSIGKNTDTLIYFSQRSVVAVTDKDYNIIDLVHFDSYIGTATGTAYVSGSGGGSPGGGAVASNPISQFGTYSTWTYNASASVYGQYKYNNLTSELTIYNAFNTPETIVISGEWKSFIESVVSSGTGVTNFATTGGVVSGIAQGAAAMNVALGKGIVVDPLNITNSATNNITLTGTAGAVTLVTAITGTATSINTAGLAASGVITIPHDGSYNSVAINAGSNDIAISRTGAAAFVSVAARNVTIPATVSTMGLGIVAITGTLDSAATTSTTIASGTVDGAVNITQDDFIAGSATYNGPVTVGADGDVNLGTATFNDLVTLNTTGASLTLNTAHFKGNLTVGPATVGAINLSAGGANTAANSTLTILGSTGQITLSNKWTNIVAENTVSATVGTGIGLAADTTLTHNGNGTLDINAVSGAYKLTILGSSAYAKNVTMASIANDLAVNGTVAVDVTAYGAVTGRTISGTINNFTINAAGANVTLDADVTGLLTVTNGEVTAGTGVTIAALNVAQLTSGKIVDLEAATLPTNDATKIVIASTGSAGGTIKLPFSVRMFTMTGNDYIGHTKESYAQNTTINLDTSDDSEGTLTAASAVMTLANPNSPAGGDNTVYFGSDGSTERATLTTNASGTTYTKIWLAQIGNT